jgi:hypothetical protein
MPLHSSMQQLVKARSWAQVMSAQWWKDAPAATRYNHVLPN